MRYLLILFTCLSFGQFNPVFYSAGGLHLSKKVSGSYDFNSNLTDQTGLNSNGTATGSIDYVSGITGNALRLNTFPEYVDIPDSDNFSFTSGGGVDLPFTISFWVYFTSFSSSQNYLVMKRNGLSGGDEWQVYCSASGLVNFTKQDGLVNNTYQNVSNSSAISLNTWYHIVLTDNGSKTLAGMNIYINGIKSSLLISSVGLYSGMANGVANVRLGQYVTPNSIFQHMGYLEDVTFWKNRALIPSEVSRLYNAGTGRAYPF